MLTIKDLEVRKITDIPHFSKVRVIHFAFTKDLHLYLFLLFVNQKKSKEYFLFYEKRQKVKIALSVGFGLSRYRGRGHPSSKNCPVKLWHPRPPPPHYTQHLGIKPP